jgi:acyl-CoA reductase-like NAD-dependent aldehyde dehydrogenase
LALLPWEFPILEAINRLVPAILAGNSILLKGSNETPSVCQHFENALDNHAPGLV